VTGGIDLKNLRHVLGKIEYDGDVAALAGEGGTASAAEQRGTEFAAERNGGEDIVCVVGKNYADRNQAVVGTVGRVKGAAAAVKADFAAYVLTKNFRQP